VRRSVTVDRTLKLTDISRKAISPNGDGVGDTVTLSFRLSRAADVTVRVVHSGSTLRTIRLGRLASGVRSVDWDGVLGGGGTATNGAYTLRVTADGAIGATSAARALTVDVTAPRVTAASPVSVRYGRAAKIAYMVRDAHSRNVKVGATIADEEGIVVAKLALGWVKQGASHTLTWKPKARRTYTVTFTATDQAGNRAAKPAVTELRVR
jgi:flagellar hook assembly protein FlgD